MQNFSLNIKQSAPVKPLEDAAKSSLNANQLNQNASNKQENSTTQNSFQSLLNKQVQAKRTQENIATQKPAVKTTTKNQDQQTEKESVSDTGNRVKNTSDEDVKITPENLTPQFNIQLTEKNVDADVVKIEEDKRKIAEDAAMLATIMQDVNNVSGQTMLDPATLKMIAPVVESTNENQANANQRIVNQVAVNPDVQDKPIDGIAESLLPTIKQAVTSNFSSSLVANQVKPALDTSSQSIETSTKAPFSLNDAQQGDDKSVQTINAIHADSLKPLDQKESILKSPLIKEQDKDLSVTSVAQNTQQTILSTNNAVNTAAQLGSSNQILAPFGKSGWDQAINQKVVWMVGAGEQSATLTLNPPDLGPVQVVISVNNDKADTTFISDNADVRQALQDGLEHLREKMEDSGIQLGQANIHSGQQSQQSFQETAGQKFSGQAKSNMLSHQAMPLAPVMMRESNGLVDTFA